MRSVRLQLLTWDPGHLQNIEGSGTQIRAKEIYLHGNEDPRQKLRSALNSPEMRWRLFFPWWQIDCGTYDQK
jgi:hypothetical protein